MNSLIANATDSAAKPRQPRSLKNKRPTIRELAAVAIPSLVIALGIGTAQTPHPPGIAFITICSPINTGRLQQGNCSPDFDTQQAVLGPNGGTVNASSLGVGPAPDEHSTVFAPGTLGPNHDYLFFLASPEAGHGEIGVAVLSGGKGPGKNGAWTLDFPYTDGYGFYGAGVGFGQVFNPSNRSGICPTILDGNPKEQDETFDMHYAASGSIVTDPTGPPGSLLMVYEGTNSCIGNAGTPGQPTGPIFGSEDDYISLGVATSVDYGKNWPTYRQKADFSFVDMPDVSATHGPHASPTMGAVGSDVCMGNDCITTPPANYGRYPVVTQTQSLDYFMQQGSQLTRKYGEQEISGFVDDVGNNPMPYIYANWGDVNVAQAQLNGGTTKLQFFKWDNGTNKFDSSGMGGAEVSVLPQGAFANCEDSSQNRFGSSISYVDSTQQYLLTFVCVSSGDPQSGQIDNTKRGAAWFYSTSYNLADQSQWSTPSEIQGSWNTFIDCLPDPSNPNKPPAPDYNGWYPTFMSLGKKPGHLSMTGYVFYLFGCQGGGGGTPGGRQFSSRSFTITRVPPGQ